LLLTLGAAGATLLVMLTLLGGPAIDACNGDDRGLVQCLRGLVDDRFDLGIEPPADAPEALPAPKPVVAETPVPVEPAPRLQVADAPPAKTTVETTRSLGPPGDEKLVSPDLALPPVIAAPKVVPAPDLAPEPPPVAELPTPEEPDARPVETIARASIIETAPDFVPPAPLVAVQGVPPDLAVAAPEPAAVPVEPLAADAPSFVPPAAAVTIDGAPPDLQVAVTEPNTAEPPAPAPNVVLPPPPELATAPPPDLAVAAIDPVIPEAAAPPELPVPAPTIDAVEIDGDGNFIAGNGPAGANMRLYVDGIPVGVSPVEGGRWLVEGTDLLTEEQQTLKVEALDALTGKVLGEATIIFEGPVSAAVDDTVSLPVEPPAPPIAPEAAIEAEPVEPPAVPVEEATEPVEEMPAPDGGVAAMPTPLPEIAPVVPAGESPSVTILKPLGGTAITTLTTGDASSTGVVTLRTTPAAPAVIAQFTTPTAGPANITVLRALPIGDPGAGRFVSGKAIIRRGDTLWDIAHRYYGRGIHYRTIVRANLDVIARPGRIYPGQVFELPLVYDD
jgi:nucleoid-associated protein YgaU